jgi:serine/threonine-protein kinase
MTQPEHSTKTSQADEEVTRVMPKQASRHISETLPADSATAGKAFRQAGRYQIVDRIGRGGMATVYKAHDPSIDRPIAIKFLHAALCEDQEYRDRFLREARAAGGLSHPNIVTVYDVGEIEGRPYMAMELIEGVPLSDLLAKNEPQPIKDVLEIGIQLAQALDYAHSRGVVHRDIKPGNIMRLKGTNTIKVTDFGIAHVNSATMNHTRAGDVIGTPQYMSPEQALGGKIDGRSDLFSVGIVLYQLLTGERPFEADSVVALALKITREEPVPIDKRRVGLPAAVRRAVERCLAKQPDKRYQTGRELAESLSRVLWELMEEQRHKNQPRIVPLRIKWAALMALIVAVVMAATAAFITNRQYNALMAQVTDYGASLARFIAAQNAQAVLGDEWVSVDVSVQEVMKTRDYKSITVLDHLDVVRVSSDARLVGHAYQPPPGSQALARREGSVQVQRYEVNGEGVLNFEAPVVFQGRTLGRIELGIPERPLTRVARYTLSLMAMLVVVTVLAVAAAMYLLATWFAKPIRLLGESMEEIAKGRYDHRIREERLDEFGQLYRAFDYMAQALQERYLPRAHAPGEMATAHRLSRSAVAGKAVMSASSIIKAPGRMAPSANTVSPATGVRLAMQDSGIHSRPAPGTAAASSLSNTGKLAAAQLAAARAAAAQPPTGTSRKPQAPTAQAAPITQPPGNPRLQLREPSPMDQSVVRPKTRPGTAG